VFKTRIEGYQKVGYSYAIPSIEEKLEIIDYYNYQYHAEWAYLLFNEVC
jgi:hypothetical protein